jgi:hypothetical protein
MMSVPSFNPDPVTIGFAMFGMFVLCRLMWKKLK